VVLKIWPSKLPDLVEQNRFGMEFLVIPLMLALYGVTAWLIHRKQPAKAARVAIQGLSFLVLGIVFSQCLCNTKNLTLGFKNLLERQYLVALGWTWMALLAVGLTVALRRRSKSFYCYWVCPLGFVQDLVSKASLHRKLSQGVKLATLAVLAVGLIAAVVVHPPYPLITGAGVLLTLVVVVLAAVSILFPEWERWFYHLKYLTLILWFALNAQQRISGPWCPIGVANSEFLIVFIFVVVLIAALVFPRAWCKFACPDGGLFDLLSGRRKPQAK
jgi:polyferredoxin